MKYHYYRFSVAFLFMDRNTEEKNPKAFVKLYSFLLKDPSLSINEALLISSYLNKYERCGKVIASEKEDSILLKLGSSRHIKDYYWDKLREKKYINFETHKGKSTEIRLNPNILKFLGLSKTNEDNEKKV